MVHQHVAFKSIEGTVFEEIDHRFWLDLLELGLKHFCYVLEVSKMNN
jgi:hypothetical protein